MEQFNEKGWHISEAGWKKVTANGTVSNFQAILKNALNTDLREISSGGFPTDLKGKLDVPKQGLVVQIVKTRNIAAPKSNQDSKFAPRLLKIQFTDGQSQYSGIEIEHIPGLSLNDTKPGTKICFKPGKAIPMNQDLLLLKPNQFDVIGGHVVSLVEKWEMARKLSKYAKGIRGISQAPQWIAFGKPIDRKAVGNVNKRSLAAPSGDGEPKEGDDAFDSQRKEAIAEAQRLATGRVFTDGAKKIVHHNVQKIVDKGFSEEEAKYALKLTRNDLGRALAQLRRAANGDFGPEIREGGGGDRGSDRRGGRGGGRGGGRRGDRRGHYDDNDEEHAAKPSEKLSLFDFIGDKLPEVKKYATTSAAAAPAVSATEPRFENNISASFASRHQPSSHQRTHGDGGFERKPYFDQQNSRNSGHSRNPRGGGGAGNNAGGHGRSGGGGGGASQRNTDFPSNRSNNGIGGGAGGVGEQPFFQNHRTNVPPRSDSRRAPPPQANNNSYQMAVGHQHSVQRLGHELDRIELNGGVPHNNPHSRGGKYQQQQQQQQQQPSSQHRPNEPITNHPFPHYDPNKTSGFLSKDTNEAAQKFLQQQQHYQQQHQQQQQQQARNGSQQQRRGPPAPQQFGAQHEMGADADEQHGWKWNNGDRCLAKYWEDGKYYNAEITGVTGRTCVVHFMEYGNYEEVLKDDCLPITAN